MLPGAVLKTGAVPLSHLNRVAHVVIVRLPPLPCVMTNAYERPAAKFEGALIVRPVPVKVSVATSPCDVSQSIVPVLSDNAAQPLLGMPVSTSRRVFGS